VPEDCRAVSDVLARVGDQVDGARGQQLAGAKTVQRAAPGARQHFTTDADLDAEVSGAGRPGDAHVFPTIPPRVDYALTKSTSLIEPVSASAYGRGKTARPFTMQGGDFDVEQNRRVD